MTQVNFRIEEDVKNNAEKALKDMGLTMSAARRYSVVSVGDRNFCRGAYHASCLFLCYCVNSSFLFAAAHTGLHTVSQTAG